MSFGIKTSRQVTRTLQALEADPAQGSQYEALLLILAQLADPGPGQARGLTSTEFGTIASREGYKCWETQSSEAVATVWVVRWFFDPTNDTIFVIDIEVT